MMEGHTGFQRLGIKDAATSLLISTKPVPFKELPPIHIHNHSLVMHSPQLLTLALVCNPVGCLGGTHRNSDRGSGLGHLGSLKKEGAEG